MARQRLAAQAGQIFARGSLVLPSPGGGTGKALEGPPAPAATIADCDDNVEVCEWGRIIWISCAGCCPSATASRAATPWATCSTRSIPVSSSSASSTGSATSGTAIPRHRREDLATYPRPVQRAQATASRLGVGLAPAPRARPAGDGGEIQRDHGHSALARPADAEGKHGHHRCDGHSGRDRREDRRKGGRLLPRAQGEPACAPRRGRAFLCGSGGGRGDTLRGGREGPRPARDPPACGVLRHRLAVLRPPPSRRAEVPGPGDDRHGRARQPDTAKSPASGASMFAPRRCRSRSLRPSCVPIGASRTGCTGASTRPRRGPVPHAIGQRPQNMAVFRHIALNLPRATKTTASLKVRRKKAAWNTDYLGAILRGEA